MSLHWYSTLFVEHRPCFLVALLNALISKDTTMASAHTTVQEHVGHLTRHDPFGCDQKQFYMFIVYLVHHVYCILVVHDISIISDIDDVSARRYS